MAGILSSQKAKLWLAIAVLVVAGAIGIPQFFRQPVLSDSLSFVCVATGEKFSVDRAKVMSYPTENPKTHEFTLLPCYMENGVLKVNSRFRDHLSQLGEKNHYVDPETLIVRSSP